MHISAPNLIALGVILVILFATVKTFGFFVSLAQLAFERAGHAQNWPVYLSQMFRGIGTLATGVGFVLYLVGTIAWLGVDEFAGEAAGSSFMLVVCKFTCSTVAVALVTYVASALCLVIPSRLLPSGSK